MSFKKERNWGKGERLNLKKDKLFKQRKILKLVKTYLRAWLTRLSKRKNPLTELISSHFFH